MRTILLLLSFLLCTNFTFGQQTDCSLGDGTFSYYALLVIDEIPNDFDKTDLINHIISLDDISSEDLTLLNNHIIEVFKSFPTAQSPFLQRVVDINSDVEIYPLLAELNNSIEYHECTGEGKILGRNDNEYARNSIVYPNPITDTSVIDFKTTQSDIKLEIINNVGQKVHEERKLEVNRYNLGKLNLTNGIYFLKVTDLNNGNSEIITIVKE